VREDRAITDSRVISIRVLNEFPRVERTVAHGNTEPKGKSRPVKRDMASEEAALAREHLRTVHSRSTNSRFTRLRPHRGSQLGLSIARVLHPLFCILSTERTL